MAWKSQSPFMKIAWPLAQGCLALSALFRSEGKNSCPSCLKEGKRPMHATLKDQRKKIISSLYVFWLHLWAGTAKSRNRSAPGLPGKLMTNCMREAFLDHLTPSPQMAKAAAFRGSSLAFAQHFVKNVQSLEPWVGFRSGNPQWRTAQSSHSWGAMHATHSRCSSSASLPTWTSTQ